MCFNLGVDPHLPQAVFPEFGTFVIPLQTVGQLVSSPSVDLTVFPVHFTQLLPSL